MALKTLQSGTERKRPGSLKRREWLTGYLYILPAVLVIGVFGLFPIGYAFYMSLYSWRVRQGRFLGLENYGDLMGSWAGGALFLGGVVIILLAHWLWTDAFKGTHKDSSAGRALRVGKVLGALTLLAAGVVFALGWGMMTESGDRDFLRSLEITLYYALGTVPLQIALALVLAYLLFQKIRGQEGFRMVYFLPYVTPVVAAAVVFRGLFSPREESFANQVLGVFGVAPQRWLFEATPVMELLFGGLFARLGLELSGFWAGPSLALVTIILFGIWTYVGYNMVIFLAGLGGIPKELYEAAEIDGANGGQKFWSITVPLLSPVTFYLTVLGFIGTFQAFNHLYVMREPFARGTVDTASLVIFDTFYKRNNYSLAAAQSILLFVVILSLTLVQNRLFGKRALRG